MNAGKKWSEKYHQILNEKSTFTLWVPVEMGKLPFPGVTDLNTRLRRLITSYQRNHKKEQMRLEQQAKVK